MAIGPPKWKAVAIMNAKTKAEKAVKNQPPITESTPDTRYTALSLPQAPSARDVPMKTIKVT